MSKRGPRIPEAVSINKAADIFGVHPMTVRRWIRRRYLKAYRVGPLLVRIPRSEIMRMRQVRAGFGVQFERDIYPTV